MSRSASAVSARRAGGLFIAIVAILFGGGAYADDYSPVALRGLNGIHVLVEDMGQDAKEVGLTKARLATVAALRLRKAGVPVLEESENQFGRPLLYVNVRVLKVSDSVTFAYHVKVEMYQYVRTLRDMSSADGDASFVMARTGSDEVLGYAGTGVFVSSVVEAVEAFVDNFALAYLKAKDMEKPKGAETSKDMAKPKGVEKPKSAEDASTPVHQL